MVSAESKRRICVRSLSERPFLFCRQLFQGIPKTLDSVATQTPTITGRVLSLSDSSFLLQQRQRIVGCHNGRVFVLTGQLYLHEQINCPPDRVQETGEREVEEPQAEVLRRCGAVFR